MTKAQPPRTIGELMRQGYEVVERRSYYDEVILKKPDGVMVSYFTMPYSSEICYDETGSYPLGELDMESVRAIAY